ncbi:hypothetical protein BDN71DRAFT_468414 [Pleurotus eryngii]|uniref:Uncharacterized protein n=1 Tax=Pleurotus eryngii TaxID=5323 RepID=A0A9P5ZJH1_PLEER|nr:hypothetical protein BDN71DRAFT_468414 [Pleurotus eryngii]
MRYYSNASIAASSRFRGDGFAWVFAVVGASFSSSWTSSIPSLAFFNFFDMSLPLLLFTDVTIPSLFPLFSSHLRLILNTDSISKPTLLLPTLRPK